MAFRDVRFRTRRRITAVNEYVSFGYRWHMLHQEGRAGELAPEGWVRSMGQPPITDTADAQIFFQSMFARPPSAWLLPDATRIRVFRLAPLLPVADGGAAAEPLQRTACAPCASDDAPAHPRVCSCELRRWCPVHDDPIHLSDVAHVAGPEGRYCAVLQRGPHAGQVAIVKTHDDGSAAVDAAGHIMLANGEAALPAQLREVPRALLAQLGHLARYDNAPANVFVDAVLNLARYRVSRGRAPAPAVAEVVLADVASYEHTPRDTLYLALTRHAPTSFGKSSRRASAVCHTHQTLVIRHGGRDYLPHAKLILGADSAQATEEMVNRLVLRPSKSLALAAVQPGYLGSTGAACSIVRNVPLKSDTGLFSIPGAQWVWVPSVSVPARCALPAAAADAYFRMARAQLTLGSAPTSGDSLPELLPPESSPDRVTTAVAADVHCVAPHVLPATVTSPVVAAIVSTDAPPHERTRGIENAMVERVLSRAKRQSYARGSFTMTARDVAEAADHVKAEYAARSPRRSPADVIPVHYSSMIEELRHVAASAHKSGARRPRVLIVGEKSGVIASMFALAGADVATCDVVDTETPHIPHFKGDASHVMDRGFDLVIAHPPCTYLSNAGLMWLYQEENRLDALTHAAWQFNRMRKAKARFVVVEQPVMHRYARILTGGDRPTQYIQPWQHGVGHTKATGLFLPPDLPPLTPTCIVEGREHAMANLGPAQRRDGARSKSYMSFGAAMATQWMHVLAAHAETLPEDAPTAAQMVAEAGRRKPIIAAKAVFYCRTWPEGGQPTVRILSHMRTNGGADCVGGHVEDGELPCQALTREISEEWILSTVPDEWRQALTRETQVAPYGHAAAAIDHPSRIESHDVRIWAVEVPSSYAEAGLELTPIPSKAGDLEMKPHSTKWRELDELRQRGWLYEGAFQAARDVAARSSCAASAVADELTRRRESAVHTRAQESEGVNAVLPALPPSCRPWLSPHPSAATRTPRELPVRELQCMRGKWHARLQGTWTPITPEVAQQLAAALNPDQSPKHQQWRRAAGKITQPLQTKRTTDPTIGRDILTRRPILGLPPVPEGNEEGSLVAHAAWNRQVQSSNADTAQRARLCAPPVSSTADTRDGDTRDTGLHRTCADRAYPIRMVRDEMMVRKHAALLESLRAIWEVTSARAKGLGLGATDSAPRRDAMQPPVGARQRLTPAQIAQRCGQYRTAHATQWRLASDEDTAAVQVGDEPTVANVQLDTGTFTDADIAQPLPAPRQVSSNCLFLKDVTVCCNAQTRHGRERRYCVNAAAVVHKALSDTGAAPSVVTLELLAELPKDACVSRDPRADTGGRLNGPDGLPLITRGTATIVMDVAGVPIRHEFIVIEGSPLMIFGNDFHLKYRANIQISDSTDGSSVTLTLAHQGKTTTHRVAATCAVGTRAVAMIDESTAPPSASNATVPVDSSPDQTQGGPARAMPPTRMEASASAALDAPTTGTAGVTCATPFADSETSVEKLPAPAAPPAVATELKADEAVRTSLRTVSCENLLHTEGAVVIPPRSKATVWVRAPLALAQRGATMVVDRIPRRPGLDEPPCVETKLVSVDAEGRLPVTVWNLSRQQTVLPGFSPLALLDSEYKEIVRPQEDAAMGDPVSSLSAEELVVLDEVRIDPDGRLSPEQREVARRMIARHIKAFAIDPKNPTKTHLMRVALPLKEGAVPHRHAPSRLGEKGREIVAKHVHDMESRNIIRKSNSPWASRVVIVSKKDGSTRFCTDFRDLNSKLKLQDSPIPFTISALDKMMSGGGGTVGAGTGHAGGAGRTDSLFLSTLDLASGFWTLPIVEEDKALTAFVTENQKYEYNYLPFGVQSGPSYMCRLIDAALQGLAWDICIPYLDDVGAWSTGVGATLAEREASSFDQMLTRMDMIFERLRWAGLSCKASKCVCFATSAEYLGHIVSRQGLRMDPKKIQTVSDIDPTKINTLRDVRAFLGLTSYYRRFIKGYSQIAGPLHDLTKDGRDVAVESQTEACQKAIVALKLAITTEPVMAPPRFDREFILKTDAANTEGIGGVLSQVDDDNHERVVAYYGRRLSSAERNYTVTEIELLAALESIKHWRPYLWGRRFRLVIDHIALKWLHTMRDTVEGGPASRLMRWILTLSEYQFTVEHKPGAIHKDADGISRLAAAVVRANTALNGEPAALVANASKDGRTRKQVVTARRVQAAAREERNEGVTRDTIIRSYMETDGLSAQEILNAQAECPFCKSCLAFVRTGVVPSVTDSAQLYSASLLAWQARFMTEYDGMLVKSVPAPETVSGRKLLLVIPEPLRTPLLAAMHDRAGHQGRDHVLHRLRQSYYWPHMQRDVEEHVRGCHECEMSKPPGPRRHRNPKGPKLGSYPFDLLYCDILAMTETHDYVKGGTGYDKLLVFIDSTSRWVEAVPFNGEPTSEQILDAFMTQVVARYGAPRQIRSDSGSNVASKLCHIIYEQTGVDLAPSTAEHHESVGAVERWNATLTNMARATDEGGAHWQDHLPFLLFSYRATPHRVTGMSPAALLYGRELRGPAQLGSAVPPVDDSAPASMREYAVRLHNRIALAWAAANYESAEGVAAGVARTRAKSRPMVYAKDDRVLRLLHDKANKLLYPYAGPYRIAEVLPDGRYQLRDLENKMLNDEFDAANLRPYRAKIDKEELTGDEFVVDELMDKRDRQGTTQFLVKWRQYPRSQATWEPKSELLRRCADLVVEFESRTAPPVSAAHSLRELQQRRRARRRQDAEPPSDAASAVPLPPAPPLVQAASDDRPSEARYERGAWTYGTWQATPRGTRRLLMRPSSFYRPEELDSEHFASLRAAYDATHTVAHVQRVEWRL